MTKIEIMATDIYENGQLVRTSYSYGQRDERSNLILEGCTNCEELGRIVANNTREEKDEVIQYQTPKIVVRDGNVLVERPFNQGELEDFVKSLARQKGLVSIGTPSVK